MPRVIGVDIPGDKRTVISMTYIHGVGTKTAQELCSQLGLDPNARAKSLSPEEISKLNAALQNSEKLVEGDLRRQVQGNIKRLIHINAYRGFRHRIGLPVRGQGTQKNARTRKGKRKTVANKKK
jgi:small subunit ribosomal protein S13